MRMAILGVALLMSIPALGATITVDGNGAGDFRDIQAAMDAAADGDTVLVAAGEYVIQAPLDLNRLHDPQQPSSAPLKEIALSSEVGPARTKIRLSDAPANPDWACLMVFKSGESSRTVVQGFTLTGGRGTTEYLCCPPMVAQYGGCVLCRQGSSPALIDCVLTGNRGERGGGLYSDGDSSPVLVNCTINGNAANEGGAVYCQGSGRPTLTRTTIAGNSTLSGGAVWSAFGSLSIITGSIVWDNAGGSIQGEAQVTYSCVEGDQPRPGVGNINEDPGFCGWSGVREVYVDRSGAGPGDGSAESPYADLDPALAFSLSLSERSPCLGTALGGADMGSDWGTCGTQGQSRRLVHLGPGMYSVRDFQLAHHASITGAGDEKTVLEESVFGLRSGESLTALKVTAGTWGGVVVSAGEAPELLELRIEGNIGYLGGGVYCGPGSAPALTRCKMLSNWARGGGGGIVAWDGSSPRLNDCLISGNGAALAGGVLAFESSVDMTDCQILGNGGGGLHASVRSLIKLVRCRIEGNGGWGGVICQADSSLILRDCAILGNFSHAFGGGVWCAGSSHNLTNCVIAGNWARDGGGGVAILSWSQVILINCTITGNQAGNGSSGAIACQSSPPTLRNCLLWANGPDDNGCGVLSHTLSGVDPRFERPGVFDFQRFLNVKIGLVIYQLPDFALQQADLHLQSDSPAIDRGTPEGAPLADIEEKARPCWSGIDIGAYEYCGATPPSAPFEFLRFRRGDANSDGELDLSDAVLALGFLFLGEPPVLQCEKSADVNDSGKVDLSDPVYLLGFLFLGGQLPGEPFKLCATDPTPDALSCDGFPACR